MSSNVCNGHFVYVEKDGVIDKTNVRCNYCSATFKYHHGLSSLKYHLQAKHPYIDQVINSYIVKTQVMAYLVHILFVCNCLISMPWDPGRRKACCCFGNQP
jgi:hypothetical protein